MHYKIMMPTILIAVLGAGCAATPESIPSGPVSPLLYENLSCEEIDLEMRFVLEKRDALYKRQRGNRTRDTWLNILVLPGVGAATSNQEGEIAEVKGKLEQLEREKARCIREAAEKEGADEEDSSTDS